LLKKWAGTFPAYWHPKQETSTLSAIATEPTRALSSLLSASKRGSVVAIDLGQRTTKAVHLQRKGQALEITQYALLETPAVDQAHTPEVIGDHLKTVVESIKYKGRKVSLVLGVSDALLRHAELPIVPVSDMRLMLKYNSKNYLQQDLTDYVFDCQTLSFGSKENPMEAIKAGQKARVLVGGARKQTLDHLQAAAKHAGLLLEQVVPGLICAANAFEFSNPEVFQNEVIALVDIGFKSSSISILSQGELSLSRVVSLGADKLTAGLAEAMGVSYAEAEGIKVGLPEEVQGAMQGLITPLGRELRASIDFFEHQQDKAVSQVFVSGGSARSPFIVESLQSELMVQTSAWNPISFMNMALPPEKLGELEQVASQLAVATGGAIAAF
jgi:type IV pilus assembly protein PilM